MTLNNNRNSEYVYDVYYGSVESTSSIRNILNDKEKIPGEIVSVSLRDNNTILVTFKKKVEPENDGKINLQKTKDTTKKKNVR